MTDPAEAVRATLTHFEGGPRDINSGRCGEFASALAGPNGPLDGVVASTDGCNDLVGGMAHTWVVFEERHYDAEVPEGVDDWRDLPFFQRFWDEGERDSFRLVWDDEYGWYTMEAR